MTTPAAPQSATPPASGPADGQAAVPAATPPAPSGTPVPSPPPSAPAPQGNRDMAAAPNAPAADTGKTFTQDDLDRIINDRLQKQEQSFTKRFAEALGITDPNATVDPAKALADAQAQAQANRDMAVAATAESLARAAGIKDDKIDTFILVAKQSGLFKDVDLGDAAAKAALKAAVAAKAGEFPEWKTSALPAASGGDRQAVPSGKRTYTRAELDGMSADQLAENAEDIVAAGREGRIV